MHIAASPTELTAGNSYFMWSLRNNHETELLAHGHAIGAYENNKSSLEKYTLTNSASHASKPPKPNTAAVGVYKRLNLAMNTTGSQTTAHHIKKVPDHQKEAVAKINPFNILHKERQEQLAKTTSSVNGFNSAYYDKGFKTFKDFKEISKKLKFYDQKINNAKTYESFDDLSEMYLTGDSKLKKEYEAAKKVTPYSRKLVVLNESIARTAQQTHAMRMNYSKIASKIKPEVGEDENLHGDGNQAQTGRGDKSSLNETSEASPLKKSNRKAGGGKQVQLDESQVLVEADEEIIAAGRFDRPHIIY